MEINEYLVKLFEVIKDLESIDFFLGKRKLSRTEFRMLREVILENSKGKEIISSELARRLGVTRSAISQIITKLEQRNIVQRIPSDIDKKVAYVRLSDESVAMFNDQCSRANLLIEQVVQQFGAERLDQLIGDYQELSKLFVQVRRDYLGLDKLNGDSRTDRAAADAN